jgi:hypothetical protein
VSVQEDRRVAVMDAATLKEVRSIKLSGPTDAIIFEPRNHLLYVTHDEGAEVWVIDPSAAKVVGSIAVPGVPEYMVYDESTGRAAARSGARRRAPPDFHRRGERQAGCDRYPDGQGHRLDRHCAQGGARFPL